VLFHSPFLVLDSLLLQNDACLHFFLDCCVNLTFGSCKNTRREFGASSRSTGMRLLKLKSRVNTTTILSMNSVPYLAERADSTKTTDPESGIEPFAGFDLSF